MAKKKFIVMFAPPIITAAVSFAVYLFFSAPGLFWEDSPLMDIVARTLSITHSPGHPLYSIMGRFSVILLGSFVPQARAVVLANVFCSSLSLFFFSFFLVRSGRTFASSVGAPLMFGFSFPLLHYSTVAETYSLFAAGLCFFPIVYGSEKKSGLFFYLLGLFSGGSILLIITLPFLLVSRFLKEKSVKLLSLYLLLFTLGFSIYFFLLVRGSVPPPLNWGNPNNLKNFFDVVSMKEFRGDFASGFLSEKNPFSAIADIARSLALNSAIVGVFLFGTGIWALFKKDKWITLSLIVIFFTYLAFALKAGRGPDFTAYTLPLYFFFSMACAFSDGNVRIRKFSGFFLIFAAALSLFLNHPPAERRNSRGANLYQKLLLSVIPQNSVVYCENTNDYFLLLNAKIIDNERADLTLVFSDLLDEEWYLESLGELSLFISSPEKLIEFCIQKSVPLVFIPSTKTKSIPGYFTPKSCFFLFNYSDTTSEIAFRVIDDPEPSSQNRQRVIWENQMNYFNTAGKKEELMRVLDSLNHNFSHWQYRLNRAKTILSASGTGQKETDAVFRDLEEALLLGGDRDLIYFYKTLAFMATGDLEKAEQTARLMRDSPQKSELNIYIMSARGDDSGAKNELRKALANWPNDKRLLELKEILGP
ncbi:DUF2723 domain-containing protein [candidate division WOR-3 bacterium]|nr:DUF2723 domain-containing protein [candidate division WOR-3 bacterium]